jgi:N-acetylglutamate synthase-like GNAT family acetyltransferase
VSTGVKIRQATAADQSTIDRLIREVRLPRMNVGWPNFVVAEDEGSIVGVGQAKSHGDGSREVASIAVSSGRQGEGIGSAIVGTLVEREAGRVLHLSCRQELQGYCERFGFRLLAPAEQPPYFRRVNRIVNVVARPFGVRILVMRRDAG